MTHTPEYHAVGVNVYNRRTITCVAECIGQPIADKIALSLNALAGIPNEQIERAAKLYPHVHEMAARLWAMKQDLEADNWPGAAVVARHISPELLALLEESQ